MQEVEFGEKLECEGSTVCGMDTGRVIAKFSHEAEAESFVDAYNSQSELSDLEIVQKALESLKEKHPDLNLLHLRLFCDGSYGFKAPNMDIEKHKDIFFADGSCVEELLTWAKQTIEGVER